MTSPEGGRSITDSLYFGPIRPSAATKADAKGIYTRSKTKVMHVQRQHQPLHQCKVSANNLQPNPHEPTTDGSTMSEPFPSDLAHSKGPPSSSSGFMSGLYAVTAVGQALLAVDLENWPTLG